MDMLIGLYPTLKALWVVWFFLLFVLMLAFVLRPSRRRAYQQAAMIPLQDDPPAPIRQSGPQRNRAA